MRTRTKKLALPLSLLALGALGLTDCGGGDETTTSVVTQTVTEATVPQETRLPTKPSSEVVQALTRDANTWASLFAVRDCNRYMGQPICERLSCGPPPEMVVEPADWTKNCTPVSAAFQESFADATVEDIEYKGTERVDGPAGYFHLAAVTYSNGEVVVFSGGRPEVENPQGSCAGSGGDCSWNVASEPGQNRRFVQAAAPLEEAGLPPVNKQKLTRVANKWASVFAANYCTPIMGEPVCQRLDCFDIENCTRVSAAFQKSFADATVEDIALKGIAVIGKPVAEPVHRASVKFSNGEVVVFTAGVPPGEKQLEWGIAPPNRRFYQAAAPLG